MSFRQWLGWKLAVWSEKIWPTQHYERIIVVGTDNNPWLEVGVISDHWGGGLISLLNTLPPGARMQWWCEGELVEESPGKGLKTKI